MGPDEFDIKRVGLIMQKCTYLMSMTVYENIQYFCSLYINDKKKVNELTGEAIKFVALEDYAKFYPKT